MEYTIGELAKLAGITTRALRHYDSFGLLKPAKINESGYRVYSEKQVDVLQEIMLLREMGMGLQNIKDIICRSGFNRLDALQAHLAELKVSKEKLELLIKNVEKSISAEKGETVMPDKEKFEGLKKTMIAENEQKYGAEVRARYGDETVDKSKAKLMGMTKEKYELMEKLSHEYLRNMKAALEIGDPAGELAQKACAQHKEWLMFFWDSYSPEAHMGLAKMYLDDERFTAYYEKEAPGLAKFIRDAVNSYCKS